MMGMTDPATKYIILPGLELDRVFLGSRAVPLRACVPSRALDLDISIDKKRRTGYDIEV